MATITLQSMATADDWSGERGLIYKGQVPKGDAAAQPSPLSGAVSLRWARYRDRLCGR